MLFRLLIEKTHLHFFEQKTKRDLAAHNLSVRSHQSRKGDKRRAAFVLIELVEVVVLDACVPDGAPVVLFSVSPSVLVTVLVVVPMEVTVVTVAVETTLDPEPVGVPTSTS